MFLDEDDGGEANHPRKVHDTNSDQHDHQTPTAADTIDAVVEAHTQITQASVIVPEVKQKREG
jgi:hypothetical protein